MVEASIPLDMGEFEMTMKELEDPNPKTWYNEAVFKAVASTIVALEIAIIFMCITTNPFVFNLSQFMDAQKIQIVPIILAWNRASYTKSMDKLKLLVQKKETSIVDAKDASIKSLQEKALVLEKEKMQLTLDVQLQKKELDVLATQYQAMKDAVTVAKKVV